MMVKLVYKIGRWRFERSGGLDFGIVLQQTQLRVWKFAVGFGYYALTWNVRR